MKTKLKLLISFLFFGFANLFSQETIPAAGGDATGSGGSASYTVGQIVYTTNSSASGSVAQGIQQPYEIQIVLGVEEETIQLELAVYPNPTTDFLNLSIQNYGSKEMSYQLYDLLGKTIETKKIQDASTRIQMNHLRTATYFLRVSENSKVIKIFKIIKR